jgi:tetratricopeptide (TPR) repeat protein
MPDSAESLAATPKHSGTHHYRAFISYSHRDKAVANWLHRAIETYRIPSKLVGTTNSLGVVPRRLTPVFRDRDELPASGDLGGELTAALQNSMFLIVICSPAAAKSVWVDQEILNFKRIHGEYRVLALIVDGEPNASNIAGREAEECFPRSLRFRIGADGELSSRTAEPIAADIRKTADGKRLATFKVLAGLSGLKLDALVQREAQRRTRRLMVVTSASLIGMVAAAGLALYANARRIEANTQRKIAERESAAARAASDYLVGTFEISNPATENPRTITALTILRRSAERAERELSGQPAIQARLLSTLGKAYNNLGLYSEARAAFEPALSKFEKLGPDGVEPILTLAHTYLQQGQTEKALQTVRLAERMLGPDHNQHLRLRGTAAAEEGRIMIATANVPAGIAAFDRGIIYFRAARDTPPRTLVTALNNRGLLLSDAGQFKAAEASLAEALALSQRALGPGHLATGQTWFSMAQTAFQAGNLPLAETRVATALRIERAVLDPDNPTLADALSMQGQILQGEGKLQAAEQSLREAIAVYRKAYGGPHYLIGIAEVYLGLIESERGNTNAALATLDDAKHNYDVSYGKLHANHGDLLVNRATVLARAGRMTEAKANCAEGLAILGKTLGPDASYTKSMATTCAELAPPRVAIARRR